MKPFIGIKRIWYGPSLTTALTKVADITALLAKKTTDTTPVPVYTEVTNVHSGTWGYSNDDPDVTDYINELTGQTYYRDKISLGAKTITFTLGVYDFQTKADLQGGKVITETKTSGDQQVKVPIGWESDAKLENVNKCIIAQTKTGNWIVFSNASIVGKSDQQDKNIGLGVTAVAQESETANVSAEYLFEAASA